MIRQQQSHQVVISRFALFVRLALDKQDRISWVRPSPLTILLKVRFVQQLIIGVLLACGNVGGRVILRVTVRPSLSLAGPSKTDLKVRQVNRLYVP